MPSPFPGMDPYLEDPALWPDVHDRLINAASEMLLAQLRPRYFVQIEERLYVADESDDAKDLIVPDLRIRETSGRFDTAKANTRTGLAIAPGIEIQPGWKIDVRERRLAILDRATERVVTIVEFLSPANKVKGSAGKKSYDEKKKEVLASETNLVEIDLLRGGIPLHTSATLTKHDYMVQVWQNAAERRRRWVWPISLADKLPVIPIPVRADDDDGALDLQNCLGLAYERAGYELRVDYDQDPPGRLSPDQKDWVRKVLSADKVE